MMQAAGESEDGRDLHTLADGWELATKGERKKRQPKQEPVSEPAAPATSAPEPEPKTKTMLEQFAELKTKHPDTILLFRCGDFYEAYEQDAVVVAEVCGVTLTSNGRLAGFPHHALDTYLPKLIRAGHRVAICDNIGEPLVQEPAPAVEPKQESVHLQAGVEADELKNELTRKYGSMGADILDAAMKLANMIRPQAQVNEADVDRIVNERMEQWAQSGRNMAKTIEVVTPRGTYTVNGRTNKDFGKFCNLVNAGKPLYMYGPAGSGKSYTAKQIAEALGYDYYETSQAMFAHELKGYGDAKGEFVETAFYRAFANGGVFFLDEVDASAPEALVVLNNAIANKRFDFPVIGNINAHENFRVVAAGNTRMTGATLEYTARQMQDTSFKNRFFFATVTYDREVMLDITGGDEEIVNFGADLRRAARETGISQLFSYRQAQDLATLQEACGNDDVYLLRGSVLQEKEIDDATNLYEHLQDKSNRWARAMKACIEQMRTEEVW
jgi:hypothetical protein